MGKLNEYQEKLLDSEMYQAVEAFSQVAKAPLLGTGKIAQWGLILHWQGKRLDGLPGFLSL